MGYDYDCVVIGAGIAGMTAAIYLNRFNLRVLLLDKGEPGGLLNKISVIENYPGFTEIKGEELAQKIYNQVRNAGIEFKYGNVLKIEVAVGDTVEEGDVLLVLEAMKMEIEVKAPKDYDLRQDPIPFTIGKSQKENISVTATNSLTKGGVILTKIDDIDRTMLKGAIFKVVEI